MQARGGHTNQYVASPYPLSTQHAASLNHTRSRTGDVVVIRAHQTGVLSGLATQQWGAHSRTGLGHAAHNVRNALGHHMAASNVVSHQQRARTHHHDVVNHHAHQVLADGVVDV